MKKLLFIFGLLLLVPFAAAYTERATFFDGTTPLSNVRAVVFECSNAQCTSYVNPSSPVFDQSSGASNTLDVRFPDRTTPEKTYALFYLHNDFRPQISVNTNTFDNNAVFSFTYAFSKKDQCTSPITNIGVPSPLTSNTDFIVSTAVQSALTLAGAPVSDVPALIRDPYVSSEVDVTLTVRDASNVIVRTATTRVNPFADTTQSSAFSVTGLPSGSYTAVVDTIVVDAQCSSATDVPRIETRAFTVSGLANNAPVITLTSSGPFTLNEGNLLQFSVSVSDADGDAVTLTASNIPTGATLNAQRVFSWVPSFVQAGSYSVTFTATDGRGGSDAETITITVLDVNHVPSVALSSNAPRRINENVVFTATAIDQDTDNTHTFSFDFNSDGFFEVLNSPNNIAQAAYTQAGSFVAKVIVRDNFGAVAEATTLVLINDNAAPIARIDVATKNVNVNDVVLFDGSSSTDNDGTIVSHEWNFGDGTTAIGTTVSHRFTQSGNFAVTLTVTDNDGGKASNLVDMNVNAAPVAQLSCPATGSILRPLTIDASATTDESAVTFAYDFGDGTTFSSSSSRVAHTYTTPSSFTVRVTVTDAQQLSSSTSCTIMVSISPPVADFLFSQSSAGYVTFVALGTAQQFLWNFGDTVSGTTNTEDGQNAFHTFSTPGLYTVMLTVIDDRGIATNVTKTIFVGIVSPAPQAARERFVFERIQMDDMVVAGDVIPITFGLQNDAAQSLDDVRLTVHIYALDVRQSLGPFDLKPHEAVTKRLWLQLPPDAPAGDYDIRITIGSENKRRTVYRTVTIT